MWIFTQEGFLSAVKDRTDPQLVRVRARTEQHINQFAEEIQALMDGKPDQIGPDQIVDMDTLDGNYDYRWVLTVPKEIWGDYLLTVELPEGHVKEHVSRIGTSMADRDLYDAMLDVWTRMYRLQSGVKPPISLGWDDDPYDRISLRRDPQPRSFLPSAFDDRFPLSKSVAPLRPKLVNPFAEAAKAISSDLADEHTVDETRLAVVMTDGEIVLIDVEYDPAESDEWYDTKVLPAVAAKGFDTDNIHDFYPCDEGDDD